MLDAKIVFKEIQEKRNHSWIVELKNRNKERLSNTALFYRGTKITYEEFFNNVEQYARALKAKGVKKGEEIPICVPNTPEFIYIVAAINMIGAKVNIIGSEFDKNYILDIINNSSSNLFFISDKEFHDLFPILKKIKKEIIAVPLEYSLKRGNPYAEITEKFYKLDIKQYTEEKNSISNLIELDDFLLNSKDYNENVIERCSLEDEFTITYSSGSTNSSKPKAIIHLNKSYIYMGRYHDSEVSGIPEMGGKTVLAHIPTHSNTNLMSSISDTLVQGGIVAVEPIYDKDFFIYSLLINKPHLAVATRSFWLHTMKKTYQEETLKNVKLPFMYVPTSVGEPLAINEEKALNKWLKKVRAGVDVIPSPSSFITMSVAGGDCEHGGIFLVLFRALQSKKPTYLFKNEPHGMGTYSMVDVIALKENGEICKPGEYGILAATSPCDMLRYKNNPEEDKKFFVTDAFGKKYGNLNCYGFVDKNRNVYMKGRASNINLNIKPYEIADEILKDTKKILSCEVIYLNIDGEDVFVAHIEPQINTSVNIKKILLSAEARCRKKFGDDFNSKIFYRFRTNDESFPLTGCGKRNNIKLEAEGLSEKCIIPSEYYKENINKLTL